MAQQHGRLDAIHPCREGNMVRVRVRVSICSNIVQLRHMPAGRGCASSTPCSDTTPRTPAAPPPLTRSRTHLVRARARARVRVRARAKARVRVKVRVRSGLALCQVEDAPPRVGVRVGVRVRTHRPPKQ